MTRPPVRPERAPRRALALVGGTMAATFIVATGAHALWAGNDVVEMPTLLAGTVSFAADVPGSVEVTSSLDGGPVSLMIPGPVVSQVLDPRYTDTEPVIWEFRVSGWADGSAGLDYSVDVPAQQPADGDPMPLDSGAATAGTILALTTLVVYPQPAHGACAPAPPAPADADVARNVHVLGLAPDGTYSEAATTHTLQHAGARTPDGATQNWCVALRPHEDAGYDSTATATGRGADGSQSSATDEWGARFSAAPGAEPDVVITLTPAVTGQRTNPAHPHPTEREPAA